MSSRQQKNQVTGDNKRPLAMLSHIGTILVCSAMIIYILYSSVTELNFANLDLSDEDTVLLLAGLVIVLPMVLYGIYNSVRVLRLDVRLDADTIQVSGYRSQRVRWQNIVEVKYQVVSLRYSMQMTQLNLVTDNDKMIVINDVFTNFDTLVAFVDRQTSPHIAKQMIHQIKQGESVSHPPVTLDKIGISRRKIRKKTLNWSDVTRIEEKSVFWSTVYEVHDRHGETLEFDLDNQTNALAIRHLVRRFIQRNTTRSA